VTVLAWDRSHSQGNQVQGAFQVDHIRTARVGGKTMFFLRLPVFYGRAILRGLRSQPDVVHAHDLDTLVPGLLISRLRGVPLVYDAHEHYARMVEGDVPKFAVVALDRLEANLVGNPDLVIAANEMIHDYLGPHIRGRSIVVMNCIDLPPRSSIRKNDGGEHLCFFYGGSLEPLRYVLELISAVESDERCILRVAGRGRLEDEVKSASQRCDRIVFLGYLGHDQLLNEMLQAHVVPTLFDPSNENNRIGTPNRLFEAMALGIPVLATKGTLSGRMVEDEKCGLAIEWSEPNFQEAVTLLLNPALRRSMSVNGRNAAESKYNWPIMKDRLLKEYSKL